VSLDQEWEEVDLPARMDLGTSEPGVALGDVDGDGWVDALVAWGGGSFFLMNDGAGTLELDDGKLLDGAPLPPATGAALLDLDGDGDLDGFLGRLGDEPDRILWNEDGWTGEVLEGEGATWSPAFADADGDGDLDLYLARRSPSIEPEAILAGETVGDANALYLQEAGHFVAAPERIPQEDNFGLTFHAVWVDVDDDGDLDLYEANDFGMVVTPNRLLLNDAGWFTESSSCWCDLPMYGMGVAVGDADGDTRPDLYVTDIGPAALLVNQGDGGFVEAAAAYGAQVAPSSDRLTSWGARFVDLDRDGCDDIVATYGGLSVATVEGEELPGVSEEWEDRREQADAVLRGGCGSFTLAEGLGFEEHPGRGRAIAVADLDRDGRPDLVTAGRSYVRAWHTGGGCPEGVSVRLEGPPANRAAIGARVTVEAGDRTMTKWVLPSTMGGQDDPALFFGASDGRITVRWPDGTTSGTEGAGEVVVAW
jgi:hypothetical protein